MKTSENRRSTLPPRQCATQPDRAVVRQAGFFPRPKIALNNGEALKSLVASGYGAALLPVEFTHETSAQLQVARIYPAMARRTYLAHKKAKASAQPLQAVIELLADRRA
jgi:DNA-binding transcriptional LysR family regulator